MNTQEPTQTKFTVPPYEVTDVLHDLGTQLDRQRRARGVPQRRRRAAPPRKKRGLLRSAARRVKGLIRFTKRLLFRGRE
jgi:hypothetical protein